MLERMRERAARLARVKDPAVREYLEAVDIRLDAVERKQDSLIQMAGFDVDALQEQADVEGES